MNDDNRNLMLFLGIALVMFLVYQQFVLQPRARQLAAEQRAATTAQVQTPTAIQPAAITALVPRAQALAAGGQRVVIRTPTLNGSLQLRGARFDDLSLSQYRDTIAPNSPNVVLLRPQGAEHAFYARFGWDGANIPGLPDDNTPWRLVGGGTLTPATPVTLSYVSPQNLAFTRTIAVDQHYMFTITDTVANLSGAPIATIRPSADVIRRGIPQTLGRNSIVHEGAIGVFGNQLRQHKYDGWRRAGQSFDGTGGWLGITDQYWLAAVVPNRDAPLHGEYAYAGDVRTGTDVFDVRYTGVAQPLPNGGRITNTVRFYAGAKEAPLLRRYEAGEFAQRGVGDARIPRFHTAVDWGFFALITQPVFWVLDNIYRLIGNFGLAILALTVLVKAIFFPLANMSYESLTKMKKVQPDLERMRTQYKDDPAAQQREMMALYQREKINPLMGCLPVLFQIPVFYALYKVLTVTIEMRHAPFFGMISDLAARDPTTIWNLFGLLPFNPAALPGIIGQTLDGGLHVGVFAILYGFTMWLSQSMAPQTGMDPTQRRILSFMPLMFTFFLSQLAVGLMIYYAWNNVLSILQQWVIMRRYKVENPIDSFLARFERPKAAE